MAARPDPTSSKPPHVGFEADMNKIMNAMFDRRRRDRYFVAIVGPRGVGKTYLAKEIYTSAEVQRHFDVHVWLPAARYHSTNWVIKHMREQLSIRKKADISDFLWEKRYFIVIDDLNCNDSSHRQALSDILKLVDTRKGNVILLTCRTEYWPPENFGASTLLYNVGPRSYDDESLEMLLKAAFPKDPWEGCPAGEVDDLKMKFVSKCEGLPWPLRFLGGLLSELPWNEVLGRIEAIEAAGLSFVKFAMSYRDLPDYQHRAAFLYFLTFPEDAEIHAKSLFRMFGAEGIAKKKHILEYLARRSMIEVTKRYSDYSIKCCRLHNPLLRLLAIHEAKEKRFVWTKFNDNRRVIDLFDAKNMLPSKMLEENKKFGGNLMDVAQAADASCIFNFGENLPLETVLMSRRVLEIDDSNVKVDLRRAVNKMGELKYLGLNNLKLLPEILETKGSDQHLTTLVVRDTTIETLPSNELLKITSLEHLFLRNTKLSEIPEFPDSLKTLDVGGTPIETLPLLDAIFFSNLRTLVLKNTKVREIPESFTNLRYLNVRNTFVRSLPVSLWNKLWSVLATDTLQHLDGPPSTADLYWIKTVETVHVLDKWVKKLPKFGEDHLRKLGLSNFQNAFSPDNTLNWDVITRVLSRLRVLFSLKIQGTDVPVEIIDLGTCPSYKEKLKHLTVGGSYSLFCLSNIKMPPHLTTLTLENLEFVEDPMHTIGKLQHLKGLRLRWLLYNSQTKKMICSNSEFPQLERLQLCDISGLEEWSVEEGALPGITHVVIECCKALKDLSGPLLNRTTPLKELRLHAMPPGLTRKFTDLPFVKIT